MNKKVVKWIGGIVLGLVLLLMLSPILFKGKIQDLVLKSIHDNLNAKVTFEKVNVSFIRNFPKATVIVKDIAVVNKEPFAGDTLFYANNIKLKMSIMELFNGEKEPMNIEEILIENAKANIIVNEQGVANYDIAIKDDEDKEDDDKDSKPFSLALKHYQVDNLTVSYKDLGSKMEFGIKELYHQGTGNMTADLLDLDTESKAKISFSMEGTKFLNEVNLSLKALIGMDMENQVYSFKKNQALINQLPLEFDGSIKLLDNGQEYDLTFATPDSDFKNFLGLIPEAYAGNLNGVTTTGDFKVAGKVKGAMTETTIPTMDIKMNATNASFKYPDLPKAVQNIMLDVNVMNQTGLIKDMYIDINKMSFKIDQDVFNAKANIKNISENVLVDANFDGIINLANVAKAYPVKVDTPLTGILRAKVATVFDMQSVEKEQYQNIKNSGSAALTGFNYSAEAMAKPLLIQEAALTFNTSNVTLNKLALKTGSTDLSADGRLDNLYGFLFNKQTLKGNFNLHSNNFILADLLKEDIANLEEKKEKNTTAKTAEPLKIPGFLDCTINANANTVVYDNLTLKNVKGRLIIKDEVALLENMSTNIFGGAMAFAGKVSTKEAVPTFNMNLGLQSLDVKQTFTDLEFLKAIAPIASVVSGKVNAIVDMQGKLKADDLSPELNSLSGDIKGDLANAVISGQNSKLLSSLDGALSFIDMKKIDLSNKKMHIVFNNGRVQFKPFDIKTKELAVTVSGEHGFDQTLNYALDFKVPAKLLGSDVANALAMLGPKSNGKFDEIPVKVGVTGNFANPKVSANMADVAKNITNQILEEQKNQLVDKGKDALIDILGGKKDKGTNEDGTAKKSDTEETVDKISEGLKGLFGKKKKE
ncbi:AsmA-like C-terminal region-containing protein [Myroides sp. M-43]|uniref:AsmA-like C-terminal region-containing protein n=1 Tax=Myroides oncorhynchi TaxID=2893756 RepID=UPI001E442E92|nr:AsmA-like C-terminal region-containing protein [Myroides oncorhynchi]MCC9042730.1 AsmA-like C-terminal region-containing protein [Myroides oncorhynchi]